MCQFFPPKLKKKIYDNQKLNWALNTSQRVTQSVLMAVKINGKPLRIYFWYALRNSVAPVSHTPVNQSTDYTWFFLHSFSFILFIVLEMNNIKTDFIYRIGFSAVGQFVKVEKAEWKKDETEIIATSAMKKKDWEREKKINTNRRTIILLISLTGPEENVNLAYENDIASVGAVCTSGKIEKRRRRRRRLRARSEYISRKSVASHKLWHYKSARIKI